MHEQHSAGVGAGHARGLDIALIFYREDLRADDARIVPPSAQGEDQHHRGGPAAERAQQKEREQEKREGQLHVDQQGAEIIDPAAEIPAQGADQGAEGGAQQYGEHADGERQAGAIQEPAEDIAPDRVGAENIARSGFRGQRQRRQKPRTRIHVHRTERREPGCSKRCHDDEGQHDEAVARLRHPEKQPPEFHQRARTRGSTRAYKRSTVRLISTKPAAITSTQPWTTRKSRCSTALTTMRPMPGQANTVSTMKALPTMSPSSSPA